ncbi:MAG: hypothetical protein KDD33_09610 [Bdellovibrionales bacterium]|nr:hypothetical protein [Bdellovibrionales bacterium]
MKLFLIGHRGVGKSSLLGRLKNYFPDVTCLCLDEEIENRTGRSIKDIFTNEGEATFRKFEQKFLGEILEESSGETLALALGAGFQGELPKGAEVLWLQRGMDSSRSLFLDRPNLASGLALPPERFEERQKRYSEMATRELELPPSLEASDEAEKLYFAKYFQIPVANQARGHWVCTLLPTHQKESLNDLFELTDCRFEIRDDLLDDETIANLKGIAFPTVFSLRDPNKIQESLELVDEFDQWDWPLEWGGQRAPIQSLHQRKESLLETLNDLEKVEGLCKLAVPIDNFNELKLGWDWWQESPTSRVFLPSSINGRWSWFRLLMAQAMPFSFFREGRGSSPDQPLLLDVLNFQPQLSRWAAILGSPVRHSLTPSHHRLFFRSRQANTLAVDMSAEEWDEALPLLSEWGLHWAAVTSPLKSKAASTLGSRNSSLNTLVNIDGVWQGHSTDGQGLKIAVEKFLGKKVAVWGGGGTLETIQEVFPSASFYSSRTGKLKMGEPQLSPEVILWAVGREAFDSEGVFPPKEWRPERVIDLNYTQDSPGILCAYNYGCQYQDGLAMFLGQAQGQQEFWKNYDK